MKTLLPTVTLIFLWLGTFAQPQGINYQGIARDSIGHPVISQNISLRLSILDGSATGSALYVETQNTMTNGSGLFNISIGMGSVVSGVFSTVPWGVGEKWLKVEMDLGGGINYNNIGTTQFLSVPYALFSKNSENANSENWHYYGKENWINSNASKSFPNLPTHDFWKMQFDVHNMNPDRMGIKLSINNIISGYPYYLLMFDGGYRFYKTYYPSLALSLDGSMIQSKASGAIILDGKHFNGILKAVNDNYSESDLNKQVIVSAIVSSIIQDLYCITVNTDNNITGQVELYYRDNK